MSHAFAGVARLSPACVPRLSPACVSLETRYEQISVEIKIRYDELSLRAFGLMLLT